MNHRHPRLFNASRLLLTATLFTSIFAFDANLSAQTVDVAGQATVAPLAHPAGIADRMGEAPASTGLAPLAGDPTAVLVPLAQATPEDPSSQRGMSFTAGGGQCRDTIPGGPVTLSAYAVILLLLAGYAFFLGRKNASLEGKIFDLEKMISRKRPVDSPEEKATS